MFLPYKHKWWPNYIFKYVSFLAWFRCSCTPYTYIMQLYFEGFLVNTLWHIIEMVNTTSWNYAQHLFLFYPKNNLITVINSHFENRDDVYFLRKICVLSLIVLFHALQTTIHLLHMSKVVFGTLFLHNFLHRLRALIVLFHVLKILCICIYFVTVPYYIDAFENIFINTLQIMNHKSIFEEFPTNPKSFHLLLLCSSTTRSFKHSVRFNAPEPTKRINIYFDEYEIH